MLPDAAGEFGNPSGHALMATQFFLSLYLFYTERKEKLWKSSFYLRCFIRFICAFFVLSISFSRVYAGRHSFDQMIQGWALGTWSACFAHYVWKPYFYDMTQKKEVDHFKHAIYAVSVFAFLSALIGIGYFLVDTIFIVPAHWFDRVM